MEVAATSPSERLYPSSSGSSGDENERILMTRSGLSHNDYYQTAEEVSYHEFLTIFNESCTQGDYLLISLISLVL